MPLEAVVYNYFVVEGVEGVYMMETLKYLYYTTYHT